jgi:hypothetical protein
MGPKGPFPLKVERERVRKDSRRAGTKRNLWGRSEVRETLFVVGRKSISLL